MKNILIVVALLSLGSIASAQTVQKGDTCANCTVERSSTTAERNEADRRAQDLARRNEWPSRPTVGRSLPSNRRYFVTDFLVNNQSDKEIRQIKWTVTLINRETQQTIDTLPMDTKKKISAHKSSRLKEKFSVSLKKLIGPTVSANDPSDPQKTVEVVQKYEIVEIVYKD